ncbi:hypothetical protein IP84_17030 [beta proteobacterium AAP99]|nr:hypothetical protein IP84_17030 [beta proteobacterium AAP99]
MSAFHITTDGVSVVTGAASASVAIPSTSAGTPPKFVRVAASAECYVRPGIGAGTTATSNSILVQPADSVVLAVFGLTHIGYIQGQAAARLNIVPIENLQ